MNILLLTVNYNAEKALMDYLSSVEKSLGEVDNISLKIIIADNSNISLDLSCFSDTLDIHYVFTGKNMGYLGAVSYAIKKEQIVLTEYDYFIISNVDIMMDTSFFKVFSTLNIDSHVAWIANEIWSNEEKRDRNPKILERYTKNRLNIILQLYKYPILDWIYKNTLYRKKTSKVELYQGKKIYAGHGSFIILTKNFFLKCEEIAYPIFLFGEEIYLAELIKNAGMKVCYYPLLRVSDNEHVSTGRMKKKFYYKCNREAIEYLIKSFYE